MAVKKKIKRKATVKKPLKVFDLEEHIKDMRVWAKEINKLNGRILKANNASKEDPLIDKLNELEALALGKGYNVKGYEDILDRLYDDSLENKL